MFRNQVTVITGGAGGIGKRDFLLPIIKKHVNITANQAWNDTFPEGQRYEKWKASQPQYHLSHCGI